MANSITPFIPSAESSSPSGSFQWFETRHTIAAKSQNMSTGSNWAAEIYMYSTVSFPDMDTAFVAVYSWPTIRITADSSASKNINYSFGFVESHVGNVSVHSNFDMGNERLNRGMTYITISAGSYISRIPELSSTTIGIGFSFDNDSNASSNTTLITIPSYTITISYYAIEI